MQDAHFLPQRIHPHYATLLKRTSRVPRALPLALRVLSPLIQSHQSSATESFSSALMPRATVAIVGFPRTGTTFLQYGINSCLSTTSTCWKGHDVFDIARIQSPHTVCLVTLREPFETAVSWSIYNDDPIAARRFRWRLDTYTAWHRKLLRIVKRSPVHMVCFDGFTQALDSTVDYLLMNDVPLTRNCIPTAQEVRYQLEQDQTAEDVPVIFGNTPDERRLSRRAGYEVLLGNRQVHQSLKDAQALHTALVARSRQSD